MTSANDLYRAMQRLIKEGQPVFPCRADDHPTDDRFKAKRPLIKGGFTNATLDRDVAKNWVKTHREGLAIGIPTGIIWDVLDVDTKGSADGRVHLNYLNRLGLLNGCQKIVKTPSGGWHLYFRASAGLTNKTAATLGLDVRAAGGYVLAPPSEINGKPYVEFDAPEDSTDDPLRWDLIQSTLQPVNVKTKEVVPLLGYERRSSLASLRGWMSERIEGERNNSLHWAVCRCIDQGIDPNELVDVALLIGMDEAEVDLTISAALSRAGLAAENMDTEADILFPDEG